MANPDLERLSGGQLLNLKDRLTPQELEVFASRPYRNCDACHGTGIMGIIIGETEFGVGMMPLPCAECNGTGEILYTTLN
jgi:hypothetical protein